MSFHLKTSKRPFDRSLLESNCKGKRQKSVGLNAPIQPLKITPGSTYFRILCPISKSGSVIGKGGTIITTIRNETGAKVRVEDPLPGDDERVIVIVGSENDVEVNNEKSKEDSKVEKVADESDEVNEDEENNEVKVSSPVVDSQSEKEVPSVQKALFRVFERMVEGEPDYNEGDEESKKSTYIVVKLLVLTSQVGCILGKGGKVIKQMSAESGAQIRILPRDKLPQCASPSDEVVVLTGGIDAARRALQLVSQLLLSNPPGERDSLPSLPTTKAIGPSSHPFTPLFKPETHQPPNYQFPVQATLYPLPHDRADYHLSGPQSIPNYREAVIPSRMRPSLDITFRLLCHYEKVRGVIGKGGTTVKAIHHETGCDINVVEGALDSEDRIIVITGPAHLDDRISAVQDAVLRVQGRLVWGVPDGNEKTVIARILVSSNQIGCLLGKGGSIIAEMRKSSGAYIRITPKDQKSKCASENEEIIQITGEFESVQEALLQITSRLRHHFSRDMFPSINPPSHPAFQDQVPPFPYMGRKEPSSPGMYSNLGGLPPHGRIHLHDDRSAFAHNIHRQGIPHSSGRIPSSAPWEQQGIADFGGPMRIPDYAGGVPAQRRIGGFGGGNKPAVPVTTTVEVVVPRAIVPSIYGEDGSSLKQIRQISGAKIAITEAKPGDAETVIVINGTPEQTHAAQSLLQAFVLSGTDSP